MHLDVAVCEFGSRIAEGEAMFVFVLFEGGFEVVWDIEFVVKRLIGPLQFYHWPSSLCAIQIFLERMFQIIHRHASLFDQFWLQL